MCVENEHDDDYEQTGEKKKKHEETLRSFAKNKRKIMHNYSCASVCVCVCASALGTGGGTHSRNFTRRAFWKTSAKAKQNYIETYYCLDPANICQIPPFVRPLNYNCKLTARLMGVPTTTK